MNQNAQYLGQSSSGLKVIDQSHRHTDTRIGFGSTTLPGLLKW